MYKTLERKGKHKEKKYEGEGKSKIERKKERESSVKFFTSDISLIQYVICNLYVTRI
jgi:hypothetical protein